MRLFGALSLAVFAAAAVVLAYDLFQAEIEKEKSEKEAKGLTPNYY